MSWVSRLVNVFRSGRVGSALDEEIAFHIESRIDDLIASGMTRAEAEATARRQFGSRLRVRESSRDVRLMRGLEDLLRDARHAITALRRAPVFAAVALMTLALGIGANTAIFSVADAVLLRALPVRDPQDLVVLRQRLPDRDMWPFTSGAAEHLAESRDVFSGLAVFRPLLNAHVGVDGATDLAVVQLVSGNYHSVLGVRAVVGRTLVEQDREPVAVISHRYWQQRFGGDAGIVGRALEMQGGSFTIVGVTPPEFFGTQPGRHVDITAPLAAQATRMPPNARWLYLVGRLAPEVSRDRAEAALRVRWATLTDAATPRGIPVSLEVDSGAQGMNELRQEFWLPLQILMAAVGVVLLVACANLSGLLIVRSSARRQEIAVRLSIGAARGRIVRQLLTESAILAAAGGAAGLALAYWATAALVAMMSRGRAPIVLDVAPNARTLAFTAVATLVTAALFGLLPALGASRTDLQPRLKRNTAGGEASLKAWGRTMVGVQVAVLVLLLTAAGLFGRTLQNLHSVDAGFRQDQVLAVTMSTGPTYRGADASALFEELSGRFSALPGVQSVTMAMDTPGAGMSMGGAIGLPGRPADPDDTTVVWRNFVGARFFATMGIPVLAGRDIESADDERAPRRVVISESVGRRYFGSADPIGREILVSGTAASIVGVVKDVRYESLRADAPLVIYFPARQQGTAASANTFLIRTSSTSAALSPFVHAAIRAAAPALPLPAVISLNDRIAGVLVEERMLAALSGAIAALGAILAAIGIYTTVASAVTRRRREIGIRIALGALPGQVARLAVGEAVGIVGGGLAIGILLAVAAAVAARGLLSGVLFELSSTDPRIVSTAAGAILTIAALAAYVPVWRASRIDPVAAIKSE